MKKKIISLFFGALIALAMMMPCVADEATTDILTDITTEIVTDVVTETTEPTDTTEPVETAEPTETTEPVEDTEVIEVEGGTDEWEAFKEKITDSATWTMIGAALMTILTTVATVKSKFDKISSLVHGKADNETLKNALKEVEKDLKDTYNEQYKEISKTLKRYEDALKNTDENEQRLYAILTLFMTNCKISESAKAEILNILADVKKYDGDISEVVAQAQEAIDEAVKEAEGQKPPTPTLDQLLDEDYMDLG